MDEQGMLTKPRWRAAKRRRIAALFGRRAERDADEAPHRHPGLIIFPNLFTSASLFLALYAMVQVSQGNFTAACWLILGAAVCDAIDGPVARLTRTTSEFGVQFDSLADVVAFGVAPTFLMYHSLGTLDKSFLPNYAPKLALGACALYTICSAIRLARFNVQAETVERRFFTGLPTPGAAGVVVSAYLAVVWLNELAIGDDAVDARWMTRLLHRSILLLMVVLSLLMVSEVPFPKLKNLLAVSHNPINTLVFLMVVVCLLITFMDYLPMMVFIGFMTYLLATLAVEGHRRLRGRGRAA